MTYHSKSVENVFMSISSTSKIRLSNFHPCLLYSRSRTLISLITTKTTKFYTLNIHQEMKNITNTFTKLHRRKFSSIQDHNHCTQISEQFIYTIIFLNFGEKDVVKVFHIHVKTVVCFRLTTVYRVSPRHTTVTVRRGDVSPTTNDSGPHYSPYLVFSTVGPVLCSVESHDGGYSSTVSLTV